MARIKITEQGAADPTPASGVGTLYAQTTGQLNYIDSTGKLSKITATQTNDNAATGTIGEYVTATAAPGAVSLTTAVAANVTSISLTAGDWDVSGVVNFTPTATTSIAVLAGGPSSTTATLGAQDTFFRSSNATQVPGTTVVIAPPTPVVRFSLSGTTTVFLVTQATFTLSTLTAGGTIRARRVR